MLEVLDIQDILKVLQSELDQEDLGRNLLLRQSNVLRSFREVQTKLFLSVS
jgi:hypothetical protein